MYTNMYTIICIISYNEIQQDAIKNPVTIESTGYIGYMDSYCFVRFVVPHGPYFESDYQCFM